MSVNRSVDAPKGALAREHMLRVALDLFGRHGFDGTTTRMIAQAAHMNLGAIPYYFGSKEDLYAQAAGYLASDVEARQKQALDALRTRAAQTQDTTELVDLVVDFMASLVRLLFAQDVPGTWVQFFMRAQSEQGEVFERIFAHSVEPVQSCLSDVVARIIARPADDFQTRTLTFLICHQFVSLRLADTVLMRRLDWDDITPERIEQLLSVICPCLRAQLMGVAKDGTTTKA